MLIEIHPFNTNLLSEYANIPIAFEVRSIYRVEALENGLGGLRLVEQPVSPPYIKDYDAYEDGPPTAWPRQFDMRNWGFLMARPSEINGPFFNSRPGPTVPATDQQVSLYDTSAVIGAAAIAWNTDGVNMLEGRSDLAVLWDIRVHPQYRGQGIGSLLLARAADWARQRGCRLLKIETQNVNIPACRLYASQGCELGVIHRYAYAGQPHVADETMLIWYLRLA